MPLKIKAKKGGRVSAYMHGDDVDDGLSVCMTACCCTGCGNRAMQRACGAAAECGQHAHSAAPWVLARDAAAAARTAAMFEA